MQNDLKNRNQKQIENISQSTKMINLMMWRQQQLLVRTSKEFGFIENPRNQFSQKTKEIKENNRFLYPIFIIVS